MKISRKRKRTGIKSRMRMKRRRTKGNWTTFSTKYRVVTSKVN